MTNPDLARCADGWIPANIDYRDKSEWTPEYVNGFNDALQIVREEYCAQLARRDEVEPVANACCPKCGAPCTREVKMRGGDYGWSTTDEQRSVYRYAAPKRDEAAGVIAERDALRVALSRARDYVAAELETERVAFKGYESLSAIESIEAELAAIDAAMMGQEGEMKKSPEIFSNFKVISAGPEDSASEIDVAFHLSNGDCK